MPRTLTNHDHPITRTARLAVPTTAPEVTRRSWCAECEETPERQIYLLLQHLSGELVHELAMLLKPAGVTPEQYHVLRILHDAGPAGTPLSTIAEQSPAGDPDVTRMLDRLEERGFATRARDATDRRVVMARITTDGRQLLRKLDGSVAALHARQLGPLGERGLTELRRLLQRAVDAGSAL